MNDSMNEECRASAQREGGFAVGQRVRVKSQPNGKAYLQVGDEFEICRIDQSGGVKRAHKDMGSGSTAYVATEYLEPADPAPAQQECTCAPGCLGYACGRKPMPPQPAPPLSTAQFTSASMHTGRISRAEVVPVAAWRAEDAVVENGRAVAIPPMTRAARVLAGMEQDPYEQARNKVEARIGLDTQNHLDHYTATATDNEPKQQAARLRMAKMSLDRPLDAERARWERLVLAKVPVGRR